jgi:hypothetical protein
VLAQGPISAAAYNVLWELGVASQPQTGVKVIEKLVLLTFWSVPALDPPVSLHLIALIRLYFPHVEPGPGLTS